VYLCILLDKKIFSCYSYIRKEGDRKETQGDTTERKEGIGRRQETRKTIQKGGDRQETQERKRQEKRDTRKKGGIEK
jgi:hypothetical protein